MPCIVGGSVHLRMLVLVAAPLFAACAAIPPQRSAIDAVTIRGSDQVSASKIEDKIATRPSPRFLGIAQGVFYDYQIFDRITLQRDLARVERFYRARGFYDAHARAGRVIPNGKNHVRVEIVVEEGDPTLVRALSLDGVEKVDPDTQDRVRRIAEDHLARDAPFDEDAFQSAESAVQRALTDGGYAYARVTRDAMVDLPGHRADVILRIDPGPRAVFGPVRFEGVGKLASGPVRRTFDVQPGKPYSTRALVDGEQALLNLGVFASVEVNPALDFDREPRAVPVVVKVEPAKLHDARLGGGIEFDQLKTDFHLVLGWTNHNFFGGLRKYSVTFRPGVVLYPLRTNNFVLPSRFLPEFRLQNELRQPGFLEARTSGVIRPEVNLFPVLLPYQSRSATAVPGYLELKLGAGVDRRLWRLFGSLTYNLQYEYPFSYLGPRDPNLLSLVLSYLDLVTNLDMSDNRVRPHEGFFVGDSFQVAGGFLGGDAKDIRIRPDVRGYVPLSPRVTLALRAAVGFLFPRNYGASISDGQVPPLSSERIRDQQIIFFRGFFAGGPNSDRGYPIRGIAPNEFVASPAFGGSVSLAECVQSLSSSNSTCRIPVGGPTLWEASVEVRFSVTGPFSVATFCDTADVSPDVLDIRLSHPHLSCGGGARYDTPVGAIRLDLGYRIPGLQVLGNRDPTDREPAPLFGTFPVAFAFGIGEAY